MHDDSSHNGRSALPPRVDGAIAGPGEGKGRPAEAGKQNIPARSLAHDLRNAVAPIRNAVQLLRLRGGADSELVPVIDLIDRQVDEIVRVLNILADADQPAGGDAQPAAAVGHQTRSPAAGGRRVLIVDDNAALLTTLSGVLREAGYDVKTCVDGAQALALARDWQPEVVLLDAQMPRMSGFEAAKQLRSRFPRGTMKLVLMSGSSLDEPTLRGAERAGFDHCIDKVSDVAKIETLLRSES